MSELSAIEKGILATLAYFDVFEYPLRLEELIRWFYPQDPIPGLRAEDVRRTVEESDRLRAFIDVEDGWYMLKDRGQLIATRHNRAKIAKRKWRIAKFAAGLLRIIPFLRMVAVCNTLAINNAREDSDIDFFIVSRSHRLWTTRFFTTVLLDFARLRRKGSAVKDKICLSFYVTRDALNLEPLRLRPADPHFVFWIDQFVPLLDRNDFARFRAENAWIRPHLPFAFDDQRIPLVKETILTRRLKRFAEWALDGRFGDWLEDKLRRLQKRKMDQNLQSLAWERSTKVIISDNVLKFHEQDRRDEFRRKFEERLWEAISRMSEVKGM